MIGLMTPISVAASMYAAQTLVDGELLATPATTGLASQYEMNCPPADIYSVLSRLTDYGALTFKSCDAAVLKSNAR